MGKGVVRNPINYTYITQTQTNSITFTIENLMCSIISIGKVRKRKKISKKDLKKLLEDKSDDFWWNFWWKTMDKKNNSLKINELFSVLVIPLGFEPRTHTLKVYCSTN
jgi:hypothetical protein